VIGGLLEALPAKCGTRHQTKIDLFREFQFSGAARFSAYLSWHASEPSERILRIRASKITRT
jgi:hypothetical protein